MPVMLEATGFDGAAVSPHTLSTNAALEVLSRGGSAVDAAIALNAVQGVVAPETCGIGGDLFALVHDDGEVSALNSSGRAGSRVSAEALRADGHTVVPARHPAGVTVPGCVAGWFALHERFGRLPMSDLLQRATDLAREGFPASTEYAAAAGHLAPFLREHAEGAQILQQGRPPLRGERVVRPNLARTLDAIGRDGPAAFYRGPVAESITAAVGGLVTGEDLEAHTPDWITPLSTDVFGATAWTIPPNSQGYLTLATLRIFESLLDRIDPDDPSWTHLLIESYRVVAQERDDVVADPDTAPLAPDRLLDPERLTALASDVSPDRATARRRPTWKPGGTMYGCVVDGAGMAVSLIESNFHGIGSGLGAGDSGFVLHDRGRGFDLRPGHPNELTAGRRPLHTLSPTMWTEGDRLRAVLGTRGGHQQPQLLAQVAALAFGAGRSPAAAQSHPRWTIADLSDIDTRSAVEIEGAAPQAVVDGLLARGHEVRIRPNRMGGWGPVSLIEVGPDGLRTAAADPRVDTASAGCR